MQNSSRFFKSGSDAQSTQNKMILVVSQPRSNSNALLRAFKREDVVLMSENGVPVYNKVMSPSQQRPDLTQQLFEWGASTFTEVQETIANELKANNILIKETVFAGKHYINKTLQGIDNESTSIFFLLRDPADGLVSNYKVLPIAMDANLLDVWSYKDMLKMYEETKELNKNTYLITSRNLLDETEATVRFICDKAGIEFIPDSLYWDALTDTRQLSTYCRFVAGWQDTVATSTHVDKNLSTSKAIRDANNNPTFEEIPEEHREGYIKFYNEEIQFYQKLEEHLKQQLTQVVTNAFVENVSSMTLSVT